MFNVLKYVTVPTFWYCMTIELRSPQIVDGFSIFDSPCSADHERDWPPCKVVFFRVGNQCAECEKQQQQSWYKFNFSKTIDIRPYYYTNCSPELLDEKDCGFGVPA